MNIPDKTKGSSQSRRALMELRDGIMAGLFPPGERLYEVPLAEQLKLSRTPIRAALSRLEQEGLLEHVRSGGYAVRSFTIQDVVDAIELRGVLEGTAARLAAERGCNSAKLQALEDVVDALDQTISPDPRDMQFDAYVELNARFHSLLAELSGSETIRREIERAVSLPFASPSAFLDTQVEVLAFRQSLSMAQIQHRAMLEAIQDREGTRAEALAREHARLARSNLEYVLYREPGLKRKMPALALLAS